jgi:FRG domain-containing protein
MYRIDEPLEISLSSGGLLTYLHEHFVESPHKIGFRGQRCASWRLSPTLTRYMNKLKKSQRLQQSISYKALQRELYKNFRTNILVNRDVDPAGIDKMDLWQLGQHHGLPTPLLDWTYSPYVGLFFALVEEDENSPSGEVEKRCLWVLDIDLLRMINQKIESEIRPRLANTIQSDTRRAVPEIGGEGHRRWPQQETGVSAGLFHRTCFF